MTQFQQSVEKAVETLAGGKLILFPTDTIWGIGCDAQNEEAVEKIIQLRQLEPKKGLVLLASDIEMVKAHVSHVHPRIDTLLLFHTRPLTVIYDKAKNLPSNVCAGDGSVAFRIPIDAYSKELIKAFGSPIVATAACIKGGNSPSNFGSISSTILENVDFIAPHRREEKTIAEPSVIVRLSKQGELDFVRE